MKGLALRRRTSKRKSADKNYLHIISLGDGNVTIKIPNSVTPDDISYIAWSKDMKEWVSTNNISNTSQTITIPVEEGDIVWLKGEGTGTCNSSVNTNATAITSSANYEVAGNIMSLLYGDNFTGKKSFPSNNANVFTRLFMTSTTLVNAGELELPATTLAQGCYQYMFYGCTALTTAPSLPATTLASSCYASMFQTCASLTTAPELPATTVYQSCYNNMFYGCTSLTTAPELPATTLASECYSRMFYNCSSLASAPTLPATTLAFKCYSGMLYKTGLVPDVSHIDFSSETMVHSGGLAGLFHGTAITDADLARILPKDINNNYCLPVENLSESCYDSMFMTTNITTPPVLPSVTLATNCYNNMFRSCPNITRAPDLPAQTLANGCYGYMFRDSKKVNYIKMLATTLATNCFTTWVSSVASSGTFVKSALMTSLSSGTSGIPKNWTVQDV